MIAALVPAIAGLANNVIDTLFEDRDEANRLKAAFLREVNARARTELKGAIDIVLAEARGESWLQRSWRPILMLTIVAVIANNYLIAPYARAMFGAGLDLALPERLYDLMTVGVGGYVVGRSGEKAVKAWKGTA